MFDVEEAGKRFIMHFPRVTALTRTAACFLALALATNLARVNTTHAARSEAAPHQRPAQQADIPLFEAESILVTVDLPKSYATVDETFDAAAQQAVQTGLGGLSATPTALYMSSAPVVYDTASNRSFGAAFPALDGLSFDPTKSVPGFGLYFDEAGNYYGLNTSAAYKSGGKPVIPTVMGVAVDGPRLWLLGWIAEAGIYIHDASPRTLIPIRSQNNVSVADVSVIHAGASKLSIAFSGVVIGGYNFVNGRLTWSKQRTKIAVALSPTPSRAAVDAWANRKPIWTSSATLPNGGTLTIQAFGVDSSIFSNEILSSEFLTQLQNAIIRAGLDSTQLVINVYVGDFSSDHAGPGSPFCFSGITRHDYRKSGVPFLDKAWKDNYCVSTTKIWFPGVNSASRSVGVDPYKIGEYTHVGFYPGPGFTPTKLGPTRYVQQLCFYAVASSLAGELESVGLLRDTAQWLSNR